ncbi:DUF6361 family protein [Gulosibacter sp. ACHW.36C]|uniref:DUF6361 family protein n=1 Tax=Gulosibacter sediminis TaxID=1729695 RepID=A0ABY4MXN1_9MICO|nr:DUF6361 family protein [Gulosibacter sediminis]UQN13958.1 DUF6361 family protein [Gulosibacter sediminis]
MPELIAWLDASAAEQQRMRDIVSLFTDRDSRDELGFGQIRDALGDALFPGSSTLHTRAKYLLFVPWIYQLASADKTDPAAQAKRLERKLIPALAASRDSAGLIGGQAGGAVKMLPSSIYWSALGRYGIRSDAAASRSDTANSPQHTIAGDEEMTSQHRAWSAEIPPAPQGFPGQVPGGFALTHHEASWLRDRIVMETDGTLLAHFLHVRPDDDSRFPWKTNAAQTATGDAKALLNHAQTFSAVIHGVQLLYNLLIAESYEAAGLDRVANPVEDYRGRFAEWARQLDSEVDRFAWPIEDFFARLELTRGMPIKPGTVAFVRNWLELTREHPLASLAEHDDARRLVRRRERTNKPTLYRIDASRKRLSMWGGGSQSGRIGYRWAYVRRILADIHNGLDQAIEVTDA